MRGIYCNLDYCCRVIPIALILFAYVSPNRLIGITGRVTGSVQASKGTFRITVSFQVTCKRHFSRCSAALRTGLRRKERARSIHTQHLRASNGARTAPLLSRRTGLLYSAPNRGWRLAGWNVTAPIFISLGPDAGTTA